MIKYILILLKQEVIMLNRSMTFTPQRLSSPFAWCGHIPFAYWIIEELNPSVFVELGTHSGNSYFAMCQSVTENKLSTKCYAIDTWEGDEHAGKYDNGVYHDVSLFNEREFATFSILMRMTFDEALSNFEEGSIDLLHIDGLHTYEAVKHDFETWLPKMSDRGVIMFHDTNVYNSDFGVWKLWREVSEKYPSFEFSHSNGLGVLFVGINTIHIRDKLLSSPHVYDLFITLGDSIIRKAELNLELQFLKEKNIKLKNKLMLRSNPFKRLKYFFKKT